MIFNILSSCLTSAYAVIRRRWFVYVKLPHRLIEIAFQKQLPSPKVWHCSGNIVCMMAGWISLCTLGSVCNTWFVWYVVGALVSVCIIASIACWLWWMYWAKRSALFLYMSRSAVMGMWELRWGTGPMSLLCALISLGILEWGCICNCEVMSALILGVCFLGRLGFGMLSFSHVMAASLRFLPFKGFCGIGCCGRSFLYVFLRRFTSTRDAMLTVIELGSNAVRCRPWSLASKPAVLLQSLFSLSKCCVALLVQRRVPAVVSMPGQATKHEQCVPVWLRCQLHIHKGRSRRPQAVQETDQTATAQPQDFGSRKGTRAGGVLHVFLVDVSAIWSCFNKFLQDFVVFEPVTSFVRHGDVYPLDRVWFLGQVISEQQVARLVESALTNSQAAHAAPFFTTCTAFSAKPLVAEWYGADVLCWIHYGPRTFGIPRWWMSYHCQQKSFPAMQKAIWCVSVL